VGRADWGLIEMVADGILAVTTKSRPRTSRWRLVRATTPWPLAYRFVE
jgi:hypothetical protein